MFLSLSSLDLALILEAEDDEGSLFFRQEFGRLWEVVKDEERQHCDKHSCNTLKDEDPAPSVEAADSVHLGDCEGEKSTESTGYRGCGEE